MLTQKIFVIAQSGAEVILWFLIILSVLSVGMILERFITLKGVRARSLKIQNRLRETLKSHSLGDVEDLSKDWESLEGRALAYGLRHVKESGVEGLEQIFNSFVLMEKVGLEKYLNFLATIGSNAPFIGLLGTVLGIMKAFNDLGIRADNQAAMTGIAEALVSTAVGLIVAIPAVVAYNSFQKQVRQTVQSLESVREVCIAYAGGKKAAK